MKRIISLHHEPLNKQHFINSPGNPNNIVQHFLATKFAFASRILQPYLHFSVCFFSMLIFYLKYGVTVGGIVNRIVGRTVPSHHLAEYYAKILKLSIKC